MACAEEERTEGELRGNEAQPNRSPYEIGHAASVELLHGIPAVTFCRVWADVELTGNVPVRTPPGDHLDDLLLAWGEPLALGRVSTPAEVMRKFFEAGRQEGVGVGHFSVLTQKVPGAPVCEPGQYAVRPLKPLPSIVFGTHTAEMKRSHAGLFNEIDELVSSWGGILLEKHDIPDPRTEADEVGRLPTQQFPAAGGDEYEAFFRHLDHG